MPIPIDFPKITYEKLKELVDAYDLKQRANPQQPTILYGDFALSYNSIRYRFRSVADADAAYQAAFRMPDVSGDQEKRYLEERELFNFFATFVSTVEVLCYCAFAIGSMANTTAFPLATEKNRRNVNPKKTKDNFATYYLADQTTVELDDMLSTYADADKMRNLLSHRGSPPRHHFRYVGGPGRNRTEWGPAPFEIDANTTARLRPLLFRYTRSMREALCQFVRKHL